MQKSVVINIYQDIFLTNSTSTPMQNICNI